MEELPFFYTVIFNIFKYDIENEWIEDIKPLFKDFRGKDPLENRKNAFILFDEYLSFLKRNNRLIKDSRGNYIICQPTFMAEMLNKRRLKNASFQFGLRENFQEDISVYLTINDDFIIKSLGGNTNKILLHRVSSIEFDEQNMIDNLDMIERSLYENFNVDISNNIKTVFHYDVDYAESGEEENGAERVILSTPFIWKSKACYLFNKYLCTPNDLNELSDSNNDNALYKEYKAGSKGVTYDILFSKYLSGATDIILTDPFIRLPYQQENFLEFLKLIKDLNKNNRQKINVKLRTSYSDGYESSSKSFFDELTDSLKRNKDTIHFTYEFSKEIHGRTIETNSGWKILLDRGLDIYENSKNNTQKLLIEKHLPENRICKGFYIKYFNLNPA